MTGLTQRTLTHGRFPQFCLALFLTLLSLLPARAQNQAIQPNDLIEITVYQEDDMATKARVGNDGTITVPLIGQVKVAGRSVDSASQLIRSLLMKGYFVNPQVNLAVTEFAKRKFTVLGQVQKGGTYDFPDLGNVDLLAAIGMAGGYSRIADPKNVTVKRRVGGEEQVIKLNAKAMAADGSVARFTVLPGDTITVGESIF